jgi:sec-independent protein translocase protein TatA
MPQLGWQELLIIGLVVVLLFGTKKIPDFAKGLGSGIRNFKTAIKGETEEMKAHADEVKKEIEKS